MADRPCNECINHISGSCSKWNCEPETIKEHDVKVRRELAKRIVQHITKSRCLTIEEIAHIVWFEAESEGE